MGEKKRLTIEQIYYAAIDCGYTDKDLLEMMEPQVIADYYRELREDYEIWKWESATI